MVVDNGKWDEFVREVGPISPQKHPDTAIRGLEVLSRLATPGQDVDRSYTECAGL